MQVIEAVEWDSRRERLVIALGAAHPLAGHALLFITSQDPVMSALCVGPLYLPPPGPSLGTGHPEIEAASGAPDARRGRTQLKVLSTGAAGSLLATRSSPESVAVIPMALRDVAGLGLHAPPVR